MLNPKHHLVPLIASLSLQPFVLAQEAAPAAAAAVAAASAEKVSEQSAPAGVNSVEKTDFDGQGRNIKLVLKDIADLFVFNVSLPDELDGVVNDSYTGLTWREYYSIVLAKKGYTWRIENNIVIVEKKKYNPGDGVTVNEGGTINVDFANVPVADAVAAICHKLEKNYSPLPAELESTPQAGAPAGAPAAVKAITIRWRGVSWQRTLQEILARHEFGYREEDGIIRVLPLKVLNDIPSETRVYRVQFADAIQVAKTLTEVYKVAGAATASNSLTATAEPTQQLVIVTAKPEFLRNSEANILTLVNSIDVPSKQVVIESRIIERTWNNNFELGLRYAWGANNGSATVNPTSRGSQATVAQQSNNVSGAAASAGNLTSGNDTAPFSFVLSEKDFKFFLSAVEADKSANTLQNPTLVVKDDGKGAIRVIRRQPYFESSSQSSAAATTATFTTKFINIGTSLYIKPKIKSSDYVELRIDQEAGGGALTGGASGEAMEGNGGLSVTAKFTDVANPGGGFVPVTDNRDLRTTVLLRDGYTVALGGLIKEDDSRGTTQVPLLGDIPVLGRLFQSNETAKTKVNLMAFITARIVDPYRDTYRDILGPERINDLGLSSREIEGASYKISDTEREALEELLHKRDLDANARKSANLNGQLNGASN